MLIRILTIAACLCTFSQAKRGGDINIKLPTPKGTTERTVPLRTHSIYAPYVDSDLQNRWFDFGGSAIIDTSKHVRLTQDRSSQAGWLWSRLPLTPTSYEIEFEFRVDGKSNTLYGDGFAMWLTRDRALTGPVFGSADKWEGLGIFFDTYANSRHSYVFPQVLAILNDGKIEYDNSRDGAGQELARCSMDFRRTEITAKAKLTYFKNQFIELALQTEKWDEWETCFTVKNVTMPSSPYLGFTAHTGDVSDEHDIISVSSSNVVYHPPANNVFVEPRRYIGGGFLSFIWTLLKWAFILAIIVVGIIAGRQYMSKKNAKRF